MTTVSDDDLRFDERGLIPAVVQEAATGELLMVAWMDRAALEATLETGRSHFWSRSRRSLWQKGETSGHVQHVQAIYVDCDADTAARPGPSGGCGLPHRQPHLLLPVARAGSEAETPASATMLERLERIVAARQGRCPARLVRGRPAGRGEAAMCRKIGEEAVEVVTAALGGEGDERVVAELADLWFHTIVLLGARGLTVRAVLEELERRHTDRASQSG